MDHDDNKDVGHDDSSHDNTQGPGGHGGLSLADVERGMFERSAVLTSCQPSLLIVSCPHFYSAVLTSSQPSSSQPNF